MAISSIIASGISIFGLFTMDAALFCFVIAGILFGGLNLIEYKKFW